MPYSWNLGSDLQTITEEMATDLSTERVTIGIGHGKRNPRLAIDESLWLVSKLGRRQRRISRTLSALRVNSH